jgi:hypothetical protein
MKLFETLARQPSNSVGETSNVATCGEAFARVRMVAMPEWLRTTLTSNSDASPLALGGRVGAALLLDLVVAGINLHDNTTDHRIRGFPITNATVAGI